MVTESILAVAEEVALFLSLSVSPGMGNVRCGGGERESVPQAKTQAVGGKWGGLVRLFCVQTGRRRAGPAKTWADLTPPPTPDTLILTPLYLRHERRRCIRLKRQMSSLEVNPHCPCLKNVV